MDIENYVHRIGRTGRIGKDGIAISFVTPEQGVQLTQIEVMINRLIEKDSIPGEWFTPRPVVVRPTEPAPPPTVKRDDEGWGVEDEGGGEENEKLGTTDGETPAGDADGQAAAVATRKPVFGQSRRRYSDRL
jgi:ATP-dependent RNA helicase DeaD